MIVHMYVFSLILFKSDPRRPLISRVTVNPYGTFAIYQPPLALKFYKMNYTHPME